MQIIKVRGINAPRKMKGCENAPVEVLEALGEIHSNEKGKIIDKRLFDLEEIHLDNDKTTEANGLIYKNALEAFERQDKIIFIGGDHSISYSLVKAFLDSFENPFLIVFDAHAGCAKPSGEPTHDTWLRKLVEDGFPAGNVILAATRNIRSEEREFLGKNKIMIYGMKELQENRQEICDMIMERARNSEAFYASIDIDSIDPAFAPGTGCLEPGGMSSRELIYFLQRLALLNNFRGADIVEINPELDKTGRTVKLGAKILGEMI